MYRSSTLLLALSFLAGCPEEPVSIFPAPDTAPVLSSGEYVVTIDSINRWACSGVNKRDVEGHEMALSLAIKGGNAHANFEGLAMRGQSQPGFVYLDGSFEPEPVVVYEDEGDDDRDSSEDEGADERGDESVEATPKCSESDASNEASEKCGGDSEPDSDMVEYQADVSLDLEVLSRHTASGIMVLHIPGCDAEANVSAKWVGKRGSRPDEPVRPDEPDHGQSEGEEGGSCDSDEADCG